VALTVSALSDPWAAGGTCCARRRHVGPRAPRRAIPAGGISPWRSRFWQDERTRAACRR